MNQDSANIVRLRPGILVAIFIALFLVIVIILFNLTHSGNSNGSDTSSEEKQMQYATEVDTSWYQHQTNAPRVSSDIKESSSNQLVTIKDTPDLAISSAKPNDHIEEQNKELIEAMKAPITSNQLTLETYQPGSLSSAEMNNANHVDRAAFNQAASQPSQKSAFLSANARPEDIYLHEGLKDPLSPYEIKAGTIIPGILITGINSDLPGNITGQVLSNVYDSVSGRHLLIPQGAKLNGKYDFQIVYGQERLLVVWNRILYPNGQSLSLEGMTGVDLSGYAGFQDLVNNHYGKLFSSVVLMSALSAGAQLSQPQQNNALSGPTVGQTLAQSLGTNISNVGTQIVSKSLNVQPTITIRPGYEFNINVTKDIVFLKPYE